MRGLIQSLWAKTCAQSWHPLVLHVLDVAATADAILQREPESTRNRLAQTLGLDWPSARPWLLLLIACHDLGKGCPGFQCKWKNLSQLDTGPSPDTSVNHAFVSQVELFELLRELDWPDDIAELAADAVGCHHGERASPTTLQTIAANPFRRTLGKPEWHKARRALFEALICVFQPTAPPTKSTLSGPDFMLLAGLTSFADWIGSNEAFFPFGTPDDCDDLSTWFQTRRTIHAENALNQVGWQPRLPLTDTARAFDSIFGFAPRPLQQAMVEALADIDQPTILLIEAPMGEGKTEAALYAHMELQRRLGHRGLYVALPTKATGNAMFHRVLKFLRGQRGDRQLDLQLLHGGALLNDDFQQLKPGGIFDAAKGGEVRASEWFTHKKRALLSEYGVGTIDQALLTILPVRHQFVRLWGLANRVVVFDEIHAYDAYTGTLLLHLVRWLLALGASVVLLSATLPPQIRRQLAELVGQKLPEPEASYPRITIYQPDSPVRSIPFEADPKRRLSLRIQPVDADHAAIKAALDARLANGGYALVLTNTVQRAQDLYRDYGAGEPLMVEGEPIGKRLPDGTEVYLFHARFPADARQRREDGVLKLFGPPDPKSTAPRLGRKILIATQVAEQSLDLDFDLIATDLAPIDLLLQRAGRLWRHARDARPVAEPILIVAGLAEDPPPSFGKPLWWGAVYREDVLLRTRSLLRGKPSLQLPDEIDTLVASVYEEAVEVEASLEARLDRAMQDALGKEYAHVGEAHQAIIGLPDDASWKTGARFTLYDDDEPGVHASLKVRTRLGEDSVVVVPLYESDAFDPAVTPDFTQAKDWFLRAMSLSRKSIVKRLQAQGVPEGWRQSALLRNTYPLRLDAEARWIEDPLVRLSGELGLIYETKETA
ncbi:CRISPR-associated helicase Cas3' [Acidithiobacillus sp. CV18-2]|nr:CRISPR-associated helicase Cas3' [Acidithiobacillus sp. CV18-3]MBU2758328.1 CRISPR-associated helicase Cas3' [Acidithiobacillus sp. BN09-2]MBU2775951.1 CRISPR-associated helicase Cas3' [Acidithiobacillus sp. CV18-2]MBU2798841.1 CRISPR-associated helicase Cas3' [Acidithiobacillus sp. VAN18-4]